MLQSDKSVAKSYGRKITGGKWFVFFAQIRRRVQPLLRDASPDADFLPMSHATCLDHRRRGRCPSWVDLLKNSAGKKKEKD